MGLMVKRQLYKIENIPANQQRLFIKRRRPPKQLQLLSELKDPLYDSLYLVRSQDSGLHSVGNVGSVCIAGVRLSRCWFGFHLFVRIWAESSPSGGL